jgi:hypothetical protein
VVAWLAVKLIFYAFVNNAPFRCFFVAAQRPTMFKRRLPSAGYWAIAVFISRLVQKTMANCAAMLIKISAAVDKSHK